MKKELVEKLRDIQSHPTTGGAHNKQLIFTQVETIFMLDGLENEIEKLRHTIISLNKQSQRLEKATAALAIIAAVLTAVQVIPVLFPK